MGNKAQVFNNGSLAGILEKTDEGKFRFSYEEGYFSDPQKPAISLTLPKTNRVIESPTLFPFFFGLLSEGVNKETKCRLLKIDENDHFTLLVKTAHTDTIGSVTVKEIEE